jgi:formylglycine-generating enzyme required for sulfatase activity
LSDDSVTTDDAAEGYRLPTEAEWEYAAGGGSENGGTKYPGADSPGAVAWHKDNAGEMTHPVGGKDANELGLFDMSGNVWEWCHDWYGPYSADAQEDPQGPESGKDRVVRGGSWYSSAREVRLSYRGSFGAADGDNDLGFRPARPDR